MYYQYNTWKHWNKLLIHSIWGYCCQVGESLYCKPWKPQWISVNDDCHCGTMQVFCLIGLLLITSSLLLFINVYNLPSLTPSNLHPNKEVWKTGAPTETLASTFPELKKKCIFYFSKLVLDTQKHKKKPFSVALQLLKLATWFQTFTMKKVLYQASQITVKDVAYWS